MIILNKRSGQQYLYYGMLNVDDIIVGQIITTVLTGSEILIMFKYCTLSRLNISCFLIYTTVFL